jgi:pimeloyl-ACP methyl ester carboxylesterase
VAPAPGPRPEPFAFRPGPGALEGLDPVAERCDGDAVTETSPGSVGLMPFREGHTWYRTAGSAGGGTPLILLHGGPGGGHDYLVPLVDLLGADRTIVLYDQTGCGNSTPRPEWPDEAFTVELFLEELTALTEYLGLHRFHLFGHSWGGMLAAEYALFHPEQPVSLTLCSTAASAERMMASLLPLYAALSAEGVPPEQFMDVFLARHVCRIAPLPAGLVRSLAMISENPQVNSAMTASDESGAVVGTLRGWTCEDRLAHLNVPTLVMHGEFDELGPVAHQPFLESIPDVRGHVFAGASHASYAESPEEFRQVLGAFLAAHDDPPS